MTSSEGGLNVKLRCKDRGVKIFSACRDSPINNPLDACTKHAQEEFFCIDMAVDGRARLPFVALVVSESIFLNNPPKLINCVLLLDVHWGKENSWDILSLSEW